MYVCAVGLGSREMTGVMKDMMDAEEVMYACIYVCMYVCMLYGILKRLCMYVCI